MTITDNRPANRPYFIDGILTLNLGVTTLNTSNNAWRLMFEFFAGWANLAGISPVRLTTADRCTCCTEPRFVYRWGVDGEEWGHADDDTYAEVRHIHIDSSSADCDGTYSRGNVVRLNSGIAPWALRPSRAMIGCENEEPTWHDLVTYVFRHEPSLWSGPTTVQIDTDAGYMRWSTSTDEGGIAGEARVCDDPWCAYENDRYRDHRAESMGY